MYCNVDVLIGQTLKKIDVNSYAESMTFITTDDKQYRMWHRQDCYESVAVEEIIGDLDDLIGVPILDASERTDSRENTSRSQTWTFYVFSTIKGTVTIRWLGESNGYYSEEVSFALLD